LFATEALAALKKIDVPGFEFDTAKRMAADAHSAISAGELGYVLIGAHV
jgi:hypothetical protein